MCEKTHCLSNGLLILTSTGKTLCGTGHKLIIIPKYVSGKEAVLVIVIVTETEIVTRTEETVTRIEKESVRRRGKERRRKRGNVKRKEKEKENEKGGRKRRNVKEKERRSGNEKTRRTATDLHQNLPEGKHKSDTLRTLIMDTYKTRILHVTLVSF